MPRLDFTGMPAEAWYRNGEWNVSLLERLVREAARRASVQLGFDIHATIVGGMRYAHSGQHKDMDVLIVPGIPQTSEQKLDTFHMRHEFIQEFLNMVNTLGENFSWIYGEAESVWDHMLFMGPVRLGIDWYAHPSFEAASEALLDQLKHRIAEQRDMLPMEYYLNDDTAETNGDSAQRQQYFDQLLNDPARKPELIARITKRLSEPADPNTEVEEIEHLLRTLREQGADMPATLRRQTDGRPVNFRSDYYLSDVLEDSGVAVQEKDVVILGSGGGALAMEAWSQGARRVVGVDLDPVSTGWARFVAGYLHTDDLQEMLRVDPTSHINQAVELLQSGAQPQMPSNLEFLTADARALPFADNSVDVVMVPWLLGIQGGLTDANQVADAIREAMRVVRPGGSVVVVPVPPQEGEHAAKHLSKAFETLTPEWVESIAATDTKTAKVAHVVKVHAPIRIEGMPVAWSYALTLTVQASTGRDTDAASSAPNKLDLPGHYVDTLYVLDTRINKMVALRLSRVEEFTKAERLTAAESLQRWLTTPLEVYQENTVRHFIDVFSSGVFYSPGDVLWFARSSEGFVEGFVWFDAKRGHLQMIQISPDNRTRRRFVGLGDELFTIALARVPSEHTPVDALTSQTGLIVDYPSEVTKASLKRLLATEELEFVNRRDVAVDREEARRAVERQRRKVAELVQQHGLAEPIRGSDPEAPRPAPPVAEATSRDADAPRPSSTAATSQDVDAGTPADHSPELLQAVDKNGVPEWPTRVPSRRSEAFDQELPLSLKALEQALAPLRSVSDDGVVPAPLARPMMDAIQQFGAYLGLSETVSRLLVGIESASGPSEAWSTTDWNQFLAVVLFTCNQSVLLERGWLVPFGFYEPWTLAAVRVQAFHIQPQGPSGLNVIVALINGPARHLLPKRASAAAHMLDQKLSYIVIHRARHRKWSRNQYHGLEELPLAAALSLYAITDEPAPRARVSAMRDERDFFLAQDRVSSLPLPTRAALLNGVKRLAARLTSLNADEYEQLTRISTMREEWDHCLALHRVLNLPVPTRAALTPEELVTVVFGPEASLRLGQGVMTLLLAGRQSDGWPMQQALGSPEEMELLEATALEAHASLQHVIRAPSQLSQQRAVYNLFLQTQADSAPPHVLAAKVVLLAIIQGDQPDLAAASWDQVAQLATMEPEALWQRVQELATSVQLHEVRPQNVSGAIEASADSGLDPTHENLVNSRTRSGTASAETTSHDVDLPGHYVDTLYVLDTRIGKMVPLRFVRADRLSAEERIRVSQRLSQWSQAQDVYLKSLLRRVTETLLMAPSRSASYLRRTYLTLSDQDEVEGVMRLWKHEISYVEIAPDNRARRHYQGVGSELMVAAFAVWLREEPAQMLRVLVSTQDAVNTLTRLRLEADDGSMPVLVRLSASDVRNALMRQRRKVAEFVQQYGLAEPVGRTEEGGVVDAKTAATIQALHVIDDQS